MKSHNRVVATNLMTAIATRQSWSRTWMRGPAINCASKKPFRGVNRLTLTLTAAKNGWTGSRWGTEAQWLKKGFAVPRGTESTRIVSMVEATAADTVFVRYGVKRITMIRPHDEYAGIQVGDDDAWSPIAPDMESIMHLVGAAFGGMNMTIPREMDEKGSEVANRDERYASHLCRAALRLTIETQMLYLVPDEMASPDIVNLAAEIGTAFILNDYGMIPERLRDQPTVRRWSTLMVGQPEVATFAAGLAQHAIDRMTTAAVADRLPATVAA